MSKNCQKLFFKKIAKNYHFLFKKLPMSTFVEKMKNVKLFGYILTCKCQFS